MKKQTMGLLIGMLVGGIGVTTAPMTGHAATGYKWIKTKQYSDLAYHLKDTTKSAYMWNLKHTKKLHNLKNYPRTTWYLSESVKIQFGKKTGIYYLVKNNSNSIAGLVARGYLKKGNNPKDAYANSEDVKSYGANLASIKSAREAQTLQADILALFPGTILNTAYSADARTDLNAGINKANGYSKTDKNTKAIGIFSPYNWVNTTSKTNYTTLITSALEKQGYTAAKRAKYKGYQIGIYATPHGYASDYKKWVSGYGSFGIYLVPTGQSVVK